MRNTEQCSFLWCFFMLYKVVLTFEFLDQILICDHSNESYRAVLCCSVVYCAVQGGSTFWVCGWTPKAWHSNESYWAVLSCGVGLLLLLFFLMLNKVVLPFELLDEILTCDYSNESYWAERSFSVVLFIALYMVVYFRVCGWNLTVWPFKWQLLSSTFLWCCLLCCTRWF